MPPRLEDDWSDSEDENLSEVETSVLLGIPDGEIDESSDLLDPTVSRIGGLPAFLPTRLLPSSSSHCKSCSRPMPLLVQLWCPFEGSAMDRALYVWGCDRTECQRKMGSVRAWRGLKFNRNYAAKLAKKEAREAEKSARKEAERTMEADRKKRQTINPFSASGTANAPSGLGTQLFGGDKPLVNSSDDEYHEPQVTTDSESDGSSSEDAVASMAEQLEAASLQSPELTVAWSSSPWYKPFYLSTTSEYIPPPPKSKKQTHGLLEESADGGNGGNEWNLEGWENSAVDHVFERFVRRVSSESSQCVRYDLKGTPLPFCSRDGVYDRLFPPPPPAPFTTKPGFEAPIIQRRAFDQDAIDKCGACGGRRVFECQLMPNLINVIRKDEKHLGHSGESEGRNEEPSQLQSGEDRTRAPDVMKAGMEWGSCFIFSCVEDCCVEEDEGWCEELVLVQWDE